MASLKDLTDEALRKKLKEHGITSPVTGSTRDILIKKLNHAIANQKKAHTSNSKVNKTGNSSRLNTFSSDEDEDNDSPVIPQPTRSTRRSRGGRGTTDSNFIRATRSSSGGRRSKVGQVRSGSSDLLREGGSGYFEVSRRLNTSNEDMNSGYFSVSPRSTITHRPKIHDDYETGSDSDLAEGDDAVDLSRRAPQYQRSWTADDDDDILPNNNTHKPYNHQNHTSSSPKLSWSLNNSNRITRKRKPSNSFLENGRDHTDNNSSYLNVVDSIVTHASPVTPEQPRIANGRHHSETSTMSLDQSHGEESTWHYSVPLVLLVLLAAFFGIVGILYVNMHVPLLPTLGSVPAMVQRIMANFSVPFLTSLRGEGGGAGNGKVVTPPRRIQKTQIPTNNLLPVCSDEKKNDCLSREEVGVMQPVLGVLEALVVPALQSQAAQYQCGQTQSRHMPVTDLATLLHSHDTSLSVSQWGSAVKVLGTLVELNPHLGLEAMRNGKTGQELLGLALVTQPTQILCHITTALYSFFYLLVAIFTVILTAWLIFSGARYYRRQAEEERQQVYELVEQILEMVGRVGGGAEGKGGVGVGHIRDTLIGPRERASKQRLWDKAVSFIDHYESRVRREVQTVGGEDCEVWRWAAGVPPPSSPNGAGHDGPNNHPPAKVWQGPAFDTLSPHNAPSVSPTSCLKIRNMFDCDVEFGDSWPSRIQDSLLEKCEAVKVVHVAVDRSSREGCVYLKCGSLHDAGRAFRALHGWWYDGNLVTVKFLRDERYHQRFPSARNAHRPLKPSNNQRLSLQHPSSPHLHSPGHV